MAHPFDDFVTLQMLRSVSELTPEGIPHTVHVDQLKPEHTFKLMSLPTVLTFQLVSTIDKDRAEILSKRVSEANEKDDFTTIADVMDQILKQLTFLTCPLFPPADQNTGISVRTLRDMLNASSNPIPSYRFGGSIKIKKSEFDSPAKSGRWTLEEALLTPPAEEETFGDLGFSISLNLFDLVSGL
jgi:hypothetical protein